MHLYVKMRFQKVIMIITSVIINKGILKSISFSRCCNGLPNYKTIKHGMSLLSADDVGKNRRHILLLSPRSFHAAGQKSFKDIPHDALIFVASKEKDFRVPCKSVNRTCLDIRDKGALEVIIERLGLSKRMYPFHIISTQR